MYTCCWVGEEEWHILKIEILWESNVCDKKTVKEGKKGPWPHSWWGYWRIGGFQGGSHSRQSDTDQAFFLKTPILFFFINFKAVTLLSFWLHRILSLSVACEPPIVPWSVTCGWKLSKLSHNHQIPRKWVGQSRRESKPKTPDTNYDQTIKYCFPTKLIDWRNKKCESYGNCVCVS